MSDIIVTTKSEGNKLKTSLNDMTDTQPGPSILFLFILKIKLFQITKGICTAIFWSQTTSALIFVKTCLKVNQVK